MTIYVADCILVAVRCFALASEFSKRDAKLIVREGALEPDWRAFLRYLLIFIPFFFEFD